MTAIEDEARSLFLAALDRGPDQWPAFLDGACGGRAGVRSRVEELLLAHQAMGSIHAGRGGRAAATVDLAVAERPGAGVGPYKLLEEIGEGGFGVVFMAEQTHPVRRRVALKVLKPGMDTRQVVARFEAERQALALMDHPNIATVLDGGETESGRPYFVMELVRGLPITQFCDHCHLDIPSRLGLFVLVCRAVQHAHQKGVIHRDLKPTNILVTLHDAVPVPKVIDFGVAKAVGQPLTDKTLFTGFAQLVGTPLYMSPEQAELSGLDVDTRSDVYSLGVLLYELLTGTTPFDKDRLRTVGLDEVRRIIREEEPARPSTRVSTLGPVAATVSANRGSDARHLSRLIRGELDWVVMRALEKDRNRRYESAGAFAADVRRYLDDEPVQACPPSAWYRLRKFARRNRAGALTAASLALGAVLAIGGPATAVLVQAAGAAAVSAERNQTKDALDREKQVNGDLVRALEREVRAKYRQDVQLADRELADGNVGRAEELLEDCPVALRGWEWHYSKRRRYREPVVFRGHADWVSGVAFSPDGARAVSGSAVSQIIGELTVWDTATGKTVRTLPGHLGPISGVAYSDDGATVASAGWDGTVRVWDVDSGKEVHALRGHAGAVLAVAYSRDGRRLASSGFDGGVRVWDPATGAQVRAIRADALLAMGLAFNRDGSRLAVGGWDKTVKLFDPETGDEVLSLRGGHTDTVTAVAFSRDGRLLASASLDKTVRVWDATPTGGTPEGPGGVVLHGDGDAMHAMAYSPDGRSLASTGFGGAVTLWDPLTGKERGSLRGEPGPVFSLVFSRDGRRLAAASIRGVVTVWDVAAGKELATFRGNLGSAAISPDGRRAAWTREGGQVEVRDVETGRQVAGFRATHPAPVVWINYSPDGSRLVTASWDRTAKVWDAATGAELVTLRGHTHVVQSAVFSPDGKRLATAAWDHTARVWDATTGKELMTLNRHKERVVGVAFSPDGNRLATISYDNLVLC